MRAIYREANTVSVRDKHIDNQDIIKDDQHYYYIVAEIPYKICNDDQTL